MTHDLSATREAILRGQDSACNALARSEAAADGPANTHTHVRRFAGQPQATATATDLQHRAGVPLPPLGGLAVSVKDLFDVAGFTATAGSTVLRDRAPATVDSPAVARLRRAGAAFTGHTQMSEFAYSGVGVNPHHGTPPNPVTAAIDPAPRIPGGSTSGGAVSVATGAAWAALGSDTGGSIRIPAAFQGLVGFKNTSRLTPTGGTVPLSPTLDTACAITRSVRDAVLLHGLLADRDVILARRPLSSLRLAVPTTLMFDGIDDTVAAAFERALATLRATGARIDEVPLPELAQPARLNASGGFPAAEAWAWHRDLLRTRRADYDPRVVARIVRGEAISAADHLALIAGRADWIARMAAARLGYDAWLSPTVPVVAPLLADVATDEGFTRVNALVLRNPAVVNFLDGCALSLPCHRAGELPVGLMVWSDALQDDTVLDIAGAIERALTPGGTA